MSKLARLFDRNTVRGKMYRLIMQMFIPILAILVMIFVMIVTRNLILKSVSGNIAEASRFNQDFKNEVDLKMYLYVSGRNQDVPWEDVASARTLAVKLLESTTNNDSRKAMNNVLTLCDNLSEYMNSIKNTEQYDERMVQLETNIYGITQLIEEHFYSYLYHEAGEMAKNQTQLDYWMTGEIAFVVLVLVLVTPIVLRHALRISKSITDPILAMNTRVEEIGGGDLTAHTPVETEDSSLAMLSEGIEDMVARLNVQIELNRQEQIHLKDIELALIQAQINPHFLYNTLDAIVWLIEIGRNDQAEEMVTSLSSYFRSFLSDGRDIVTIAEEQNHIRSYLEIQQVRYRDIMEYDIKIAPAIEQYKLPKMTLQPLIENAIYHGLKPKRGKGMITVLGYSEGDSIVLEVKDTGVGMSQYQLDSLRSRITDEDQTSFGLVSAYKRLKLLYGDLCSFDVESGPNEGTKIVIHIPRKADIDDETVL